MSVGSIKLSLFLGSGIPSPAPSDLMRALRAVSITQTDTAPCGFQLTFQTELTNQSAFALVQTELLRPFSRALVRIDVDGDATTLIDGFITHQQYMPSNGPDHSAFVVTGEDVSVKMDLITQTAEFPSQTDPDIAQSILATWQSVGILPRVVQGLTTMLPFEFVPQQNATDRAFLQQLAQRNGNVFYVTPRTTLFQNTAYWGPPARSATPSAVIDVAVGAATTVRSVQASYDALAPETTLGYAMETMTDPYLPIPVVTFESLRKPLASRPALTPAGIFELSNRRVPWPASPEDAGVDPLLALFRSQARTDVSTDAVVSIDCQVSPLDLGTVVQAPDVVGLRGTGGDYDGLYYLKQATHEISLYSGAQWDYVQNLVLTREGVGTTSHTLEAR